MIWFFHLHRIIVHQFRILKQMRKNWKVQTKIYVVKWDKWFRTLIRISRKPLTGKCFICMYFNTSFWFLILKLYQNFLYPLWVRRGMFTLELLARNKVPGVTCVLLPSPCHPCFPISLPPILGVKEPISNIMKMQKPSFGKTFWRGMLQRKNNLFRRMKRPFLS